jgi:high-affinity iron transporter
MLATAIIVFREVLEAGLIVGIVLAATQGVAGSGRYVASGVAAGVLGAVILAIFAGSLSNALAGMGQEVFNASVLGIAVVMLAWHNIWMAHHGREMAANLKAAGRAVVDGSKTLFALAAVVAIAVLREGAEVVLFLYGVAVSSGDSTGTLLTGGVLGLAAGAAVSAATFLGLAKIPSRALFSVTSTMIAFLAAGMAGQCVSYLERADISTMLTSTLWDTSWLVPADSIFGRVLRALIGYDDRPSIMQGIVYLATLASILIATRLVQLSAAGARKPAAPAAKGNTRLAV